MATPARLTPNLAATAWMGIAHQGDLSEALLCDLRRGLHGTFLAALGQDDVLHIRLGLFADALDDGHW